MNVDGLPSYRDSHTVNVDRWAAINAKRRTKGKLRTLQEYLLLFFRSYEVSSHALIGFIWKCIKHPHKVNILCKRLAGNFKYTRRKLLWNPWTWILRSWPCPKRMALQQASPSWNKHLYMACLKLRFNRTISPFFF